MFFLNAKKKLLFDKKSATIICYISEGKKGLFWMDCHFKIHIELEFAFERKMVSH